MTQPIHRIVYNNFSGGMFGMLKSVLCALADCERLGLSPQVEVCDSPYREDGYVGNVWTRFFETIGDTTQPPDTCEDVMYHPCLKKYDYSTATRVRMCALLHRYVRPRAEIRARIDTWSAQLVGARVGVHYRGADGSKVYPFVPPAEYLRGVQILENRRPPYPWLLATDSTAAADVIVGPGRVLTDSERVPELQCGYGVHFRAKDRGKAGSDAILDAWLLARCDMLLCGPSNLADVVTYLNPHILRVSP
jgi:hypothetical protein